MPAYYDSGFSVRQPMWHNGLTDTIDDYPTDWNDARSKAKLTWEPEVVGGFVPWSLDDFGISHVDLVCGSCSAALGKPHQSACDYSLTGPYSDDGAATEHVEPFQIDVIDAKVTPDLARMVRVESDTIWLPIADTRIVVRNDTKADLAPVGTDFALIYHGGKERASMENIVEAFAGADGGLKFETAGSARGGRDVWALMYLDEPFTIPGDEALGSSVEHFPFLALLNSHGGGACKLVYTQVRVVCWNTFQMASAQGDRTGAQIVFRHVGSVGDRIDAAKQSIADLRKESVEYVELAADMLKLNANDKHLSKFISEFIPSPAENGEVVSDRVTANVDKARDMFRAIYNDSVTCESVKGTAWGLVQASTEYLDHARSYRNPESYLGRSILRPEPAKAKAIALARRVCK